LYDRVQNGDELQVLLCQELPRGPDARIRTGGGGGAETEHQEQEPRPDGPQRARLVCEWLRELARVGER
jgi:hypothetical protein